VTDPQASSRHDDVQMALAKTRIAPDLLSELSTVKTHVAATPPEGREAEAKPLIAVIIEMNAGFPKGVGAARALLLDAFLKQQAAAGVKVPEAGLARQSLVGRGRQSLLSVIGPLFDPADKIAVANSLFTDNYLFGEFTVETINRLAPLAIDTGGGAKKSPIYKLWKDHTVEPLVFETTRTIKCDAARAAFGCEGKDIVWAVADTGIDGTHPHFETHKTLDLPRGVRHRDFTEAYASDAIAEKPP
jgi:hypothetical protein